MASTKHKARGLAYSRSQMEFNIGKITGGVIPSFDDVIAASPVPIDRNPLTQGFRFMDELYDSHDHLHLQAARMTPDGKCQPTGEMIIDTKIGAQKLFFRKHLSLHLYVMGGFIGINGLRTNVGSGKGGRPTDADIRHHEYLLIEHDEISREQQIALLTSLALPIVSPVDSGGKSIHALVRVGARSAKEYEEIARAIYRPLAAFGFDPSNINPSRLTRLPGTSRSHPGAAPGQQRLLYLDPHANNTPIIRRITTMLGTQKH